MLRSSRSLRSPWALTVLVSLIMGSAAGAATGVPVDASRSSTVSHPDQPTPRGGGTAAVKQSRAQPATPRGGIVFVRRSKLWVASADGTVRRQLRLDGTGSSPWRDPSMATDGTIVAFRNRSYLVGTKTNQRGRIYRLNQAGRILNSFEPRQLDSRDDQVSRGNGITSLAVSPDGAYIAWQHSWLCPDPSAPGFDTLCWFTEVARANGTNSYLIGTKADMSRMGSPSWADDAAHTLLMSRGGFEISYYPLGADLGQAPPPLWFGHSDFDFQSDPDLRSGLLALVGLFDTPGGSVEAIQVLTTNGPRPAEPTSACFLQGPAGSFQDPTWGPGGYLAWTESDSDTVAPEPSGEGLWVGRIAVSGQTCTLVPINGLPLRPVVADAETAEWGPQFVGAARRTRGSLQFSAGAGVGNDVVVEARSSTTYAVRDRSRHRLAAGAGCVRLSAIRASCSSVRLRGVWLSGQDGADRLVVAVGRPSRLFGGDGNDRLYGGAGRDQIRGGAGRDVVSGRGGDDVVAVRDGERDSVNCGRGRDRVVADAVDVLTACESVSR